MLKHGWNRFLSAILVAGILLSTIPAALGAGSAQEFVYEAVSPVAGSGSASIALRGTMDEVQTYFDRRGWTDGLPIVPPTDEKVLDYLRYTPYKASDVIVKEGGFTAYSVAVNAIMAGCPAQYMPICIALAKACNEGAWVDAVKSARAETPFAWLNGPLARQLGIDRGQGMISEANNKVLARFLDLALLNLAGVDLERGDSAFGTVGTFVFAEDDEACLNVGWQPYHVTQGMDLDENAVTVSAAASWGNNLTPATPDAEKTMEVIAFDITEKGDSALGSGQPHCQRTILVSEAVAENLAAGYASKDALERALVATALRPFDLRAYARYWANPTEKVSDKEEFKTYFNKLKSAESPQQTGVPKWYRPLFPNTQRILTTATMVMGETRILVTGDSSRNKVQTMSGGTCVTVKIELPDTWNALMTALTVDPQSYYYYEPISNFYLGKNAVDTTGSIACGPEGCRTDMKMPAVTASSKPAAKAEPTYSVMSPQGNVAIERISQAPRLDTLAGKRIALVGRSFNADITQDVIKKLILRDYPTASIYSFEDVGYPGNYTVLNQSDETKQFQQKLQDYQIDAVITGNCGCGLCTVKECGAAIAAEYVGVPAVAVGSTSFIAAIHSTGTNRGVPVLRAVEYPGAFASESVETLKQKAETYLYPGIVEALTTQITRSEIDSLAKSGDQKYDEAVFTGTYDSIQAYYKTLGWTDGLPIGLPTDEKVREYLNYTPYDGADVLGIYPVAYREARAYTVAVNAVMAGCPAEYMPLCVAFVKCMDNPEWRRPLASTHGWSPYAWLNGPLARQLGIESGAGMMNAENNRKFARFIDLAMLNIGGYQVKENRMGTFGYLTPWVFAEDEQACLDAGWKPYHVTKGKGINDNTLTTASALFFGNDLAPLTDEAEKIANVVAFDVTEKQQNALGNTNAHVTRTMCVTADVAKKLSGAYAAKTDFEAALIGMARRPLWLRTYARYWASPSGSQYATRTMEQYYKMLIQSEDEGAKKTSAPVWYRTLLDNEIMTIATMKRGETPVLVTGQPDGNRVQTIPGGGYTTREIELPDNWDALMDQLGYLPLSRYYLGEGNGAELPSAGSRRFTLTIGKKTANVYGTAVTNDVSPVIRNGRTMLPARFVAENLGAQVYWNASRPDEVVITKGNLRIVLTIGSSTAQVDGKAVTLDSAPYIEDGRTFCPVRFICETLGARVDWNEGAQEVIVTAARGAS